MSSIVLGSHLAAIDVKVKCSLFQWEQDLTKSILPSISCGIKNISGIPLYCGYCILANWQSGGCIRSMSANFLSTEMALVNQMSSSSLWHRGRLVLAGGGMVVTVLQSLMWDTYNAPTEGLPQDSTQLRFPRVSLQNSW